MDADVTCQNFLSDERQRTRETALLLGPHSTCGTRFPGVSVKSPVKRSWSSKKKLDKILAFYPDELRCAKSGNTFDRYGRRSNSIYDHYKNKAVKAKLDEIKTI